LFFVLANNSFEEVEEKKFEASSAAMAWYFMLTMLSCKLSLVQEKSISARISSKKWGGK
jgi:hypothetical protein